MRTSKEMSQEQEKRIAIVLGSGGFRGPAHVGVLERLKELEIPLHSLIGCSVGSVVGAYYAAVGLPIDELLEHAFGIQLMGVVGHAVTLRSDGKMKKFFSRWSEPVHRRLDMLEQHDFRRLHHGVRTIGFLMHDLVRSERIFAVTGRERGFSLSEAVRASARVPFLFPPMRKEVDGLERRLVDGGLSAPTPVVHAVSAPVSATHVIAVDITASRKRAPQSELARWQRLLGDRLLIVRPRPPALNGRPGGQKFVQAWYEAGKRAIGQAEEMLLWSWMEGRSALTVAGPSDRFIGEEIPSGAM